MSPASIGRPSTRPNAASGQDSQPAVSRGRSVDQPERVAGDQHADADIGLAQQAFQPLVRARFPFPGSKLVAVVSIECRMEHDERLGGHALGRRSVPQHRHVGREQRFALGNDGVQMAVDRGSPWAPGDELGGPAEHGLEKPPGIVKFEKPVVLAARVRVEAQRFRGFLRVERRLADGRQPLFAQDVRADH